MFQAQRGRHRAAEIEQASNSEGEEEGEALHARRQRLLARRREVSQNAAFSLTGCLITHRPKSSQIQTQTKRTKQVKQIVLLPNLHQAQRDYNRKKKRRTQQREEQGYACGCKQYSTMMMQQKHQRCSEWSL